MKQSEKRHIEKNNNPRGKNPYKAMVLKKIISGCFNEIGVLLGGLASSKGGLGKKEGKKLGNQWGKNLFRQKMEALGNDEKPHKRVERGEGLCKLGSTVLTPNG